MGMAVGLAARALFAISGIDDLNTLSALKGEPLAKKTVVFTASNDAIMRDEARLSAGLKKQNMLGNLVCHDIAGGHNRFGDYFNPDDTHRQAWIDAAAFAVNKALP